jgi:isopentenyldiphosphate isomerase
MERAEGEDFSRLTQADLWRLRAEALAAGRRDRAEAAAREMAARQRRHFRGEMLDIYDDSLAPAGVKERGAVHLDGDWHRSFHCWLVAPARGALLLQRRALAKETNPGLLDTTVAGHYRAGEGPREGCREAEEELGLVLDPDRLVPIGRGIFMARFGYLIDREVADLFLYATDASLTDLRPDPAEVAEVLEMPVADALALFAGEVAEVRALGWAPGAGPRPVRVRAGEFTPHHDRHLARVALQARRLLRGEVPLPI